MSLNASDAIRSQNDTEKFLKHESSQESNGTSRTNPSSKRSHDTHPVQNQMSNNPRDAREDVPSCLVADHHPDPQILHSFTKKILTNEIDTARCSKTYHVVGTFSTTFQILKQSDFDMPTLSTTEECKQHHICSLHRFSSDVLSLVISSSLSSKFSRIRSNASSLQISM